MNKFDKNFWEDKYQNNESGWDLGGISSPLKKYIDQIEDKNIKILIPGAGNSHEAEYLFEKGFQNIYVLDIAPSAVKNFKERVPQFPKTNILCDDFFTFQMAFDLIIEQTFFCAIDPSWRAKYALQCSNLLNEGGKLCGLMFNFPLTEDGPPFGGCAEEYQQYFSPYFKIEKMEEAYNSIEKRKGRELFVKMIKK